MTRLVLDPNRQRADRFHTAAALRATGAHIGLKVIENVISDSIG
jgi:hypothetical protein